MSSQQEDRMRKTLAVVIVAFFISVSISAAPQTWTGQIGDSMCGAKHASMGSQKMTARECTEMCIKGGAKYIFATGGKVFQIADQKDKMLATHAGHTVLLTGELKGDTITVSKIEMPKAEKK
jgi:hypothetical protein